MWSSCRQQKKVVSFRFQSYATINWCIEIEKIILKKCKNPVSLICLPNQRHKSIQRHRSPSRSSQMNSLDFKLESQIIYANIKLVLLSTHNSTNRLRLFRWGVCYCIHLSFAFNILGLKVEEREISLAIHFWSQNESLN